MGICDKKTLYASGSFSRSTGPQDRQDLAMAREWTPGDPEDGAVADYDSIISGYKKVAADLRSTDRRQFIHDNAAKPYGR